MGVALRLKAPALEKLAVAEAPSLAKSAVAEAPSISKSSLQFGKLPEVPPGQVVIPSFRTEGGFRRATMTTVPELNIVNANSIDAQVYKAAKSSTFQVLKGERIRGGTGFLVDESG